MTPLNSYTDLPGRAIFNPLGAEPWVLNVTAVSVPDPDGLITISAVEGEVECASDLRWPAFEYDLATADLIASLVLEQQMQYPPGGAA